MRWSAASTSSRTPHAAGVLRHFQARNRHAAGVGGLAGPVEHVGFLEDLNRLGRRGHVGAFGNAHAAVLDQRRGRHRHSSSFCVAHGEGQLRRNAPGRLPGMNLEPLNLSAYSLMRPRCRFFELHHPRELLRIDAGGVVNRPARIRQRDGLGAKLGELLDRVLGHVARAADQGDLARHLLAAGVQHFLREVGRAVACRLRTHERAAPIDALARQHALEPVRQASCTGRTCSRSRGRPRRCRPRARPRPAPMMLAPARS